jgi:hypothetical protein
MLALAAAFLQQLNSGEGHAPVHGLAHVVDDARSGFCASQNNNIAPPKPHQILHCYGVNGINLG